MVRLLRTCHYTHKYVYIYSCMPCRVLLVTPSNSASDLLADRLLKSKVTSIVRLNAYQVSGAPVR